MHSTFRTPLPRPEFSSVREYGSRLTDVAYWRPYAEAVCQRHGISCAQVRAGLPGTFPAFIVDDRLAVKLFGEAFHGGEDYAVELEVYGLLGGLCDFPAPRLVAKGELFSSDDGWPWPYIVSSRIRGRSLGEVHARVSYGDKAALAIRLGALVRRLHDTPLDPAASLKPTWDSFVAFIQERRANCVRDHLEWGTLPERLVAQIDEYLLPPEALFDHTRRPSLLHADITADHILGEFTPGGWALTGLIDFGDSMVGDPIYELMALHLDAFRRDKGLLRAFLQSYGFEGSLRRDFCRRAMSYTLLHEFNALKGSLEDSAAREAQSLGGLARWLWDVGIE